MNSGNITAIVLALIAMAGTAFGLYVNRTDRATNLTRQNVENMVHDTRLMKAMRTDVWNWEKWGHGVVDAWDEMQRDLKASGHLTEMHPLPVFPESELEKVERELSGGKGK